MSDARIERGGLYLELADRGLRRREGHANVRAVGERVSVAVDREFVVADLVRERALVELDPPPELQEHVTACVMWSRINVIACPEHFERTAEHLKEIKAAQKQADAFFDPLVRQAYDLHKSIVARKKILTGPLDESERVDKMKMIAYEKEQQRIAEAERRRLQAIADEQARKEREKIEQARAKQAAIEAEARRVAEAARLKAEETANAAKRKKLLEEAASAERIAARAAAKQEVAEENAAAVVAPVIAVASAAPKTAGISVRKSWKAEIVDLSAFLLFACENKRTDLLLPNMKVLEALAKGLKDQAAIPGVKFSEESVMSASSR